MTQRPGMLNNLLTGILILFLFWVAISTGLMALCHPQLTQTELFLNIPRAILLKEPRTP